MVVDHGVATQSRHAADEVEAWAGGDADFWNTSWLSNSNFPSSRNAKQIIRQLSDIVKSDRQILYIMGIPPVRCLVRPPSPPCCGPRVSPRENSNDQPNRVKSIISNYSEIPIVHYLCFSWSLRSRDSSAGYPNPICQPTYTQHLSSFVIPHRALWGINIYAAAVLHRSSALTVSALALGSHGFGTWHDRCGA
jgi:hypothetical protein